MSDSIIEVWMPIKGFEGLYSVSNMGQVRSNYKGRGRYRIQSIGRILSPKKHPQGYHSVNLWKDKKQKSFLIHKLVLEAFADGIPDGFVTNHINGIKSDNRFHNLEVVTQSENVSHAHEHKLIPFSGAKGTANGRARITEDQVIEIRNLKGEMPVKEIADKYGLKVAGIEKIIYGKSWKHLKQTNT